MTLRHTTMDTNIIERMEMVLAKRHETKNSFALSVGIATSNFTRKMKGTQAFTKRDFMLISKATGISREWLEFGEGDMMAKQGATAPQVEEDRPTVEGKPFYDVDFALGFNGMYNDEPNVPSKIISVPGYEKADFWCRTSGDSMKPFISNGDIIALKEIDDWQSFLPMNEVYAIMTTNELRTVKVVRKGSDDEHLTLHAYNEEYEDQEISKSAITKVFKVIGALKTM
mgnify:CR=1 FL=1